MGSWCSVENTKTNIIEVEEFDNFHETFIGVPFIDEIKTGDKDTAIINTFRKTLSSSVFKNMILFFIFVRLKPLGKILQLDTNKISKKTTVENKQ